jgi:hypothetical protein
MRNEIPDCGAPRWNETKKETVLFAFGGEKPREQDAVGGARLTIEIGADFPIGPNRILNELTLVDSFERKSLVSKPMRAHRANFWGI